METGQNELQLAGVVADIADGEHAARAGLELLGIHRNQVLMQVEPEGSHRPQLHGEPIKSQKPIARDRPFIGFNGVYLGARTRNARYVGNHKLHFAVGHQLFHAANRIGGCAEIVTPVHQRQLFDDRLQVDGPVECGIAATRDHHFTIAVRFHFAHGIKDRRALIRFNPGNRGLFGHKGSAARSNHDNGRAQGGALIRCKHPVFAVAFQFLGHLAKMERGAKGFDLLHQPVGQFLARDGRQGRNVVNGLFRVQLGALAAWFFKDIDQMGLEIEQAKFENGKKPHGPRADDDNVSGNVAFVGHGKENTYAQSNDKALTLDNTAALTRPPSRDASCANWLLMCAVMVFLMAVIGAVTRLTESGLSITSWKPVTGAIPPLTQNEWLDEFAAYQQTPEFIKKNAGMTLADFKYIFFWEWLHRLWGRLIGLFFAVPLAYFWLRGRLAEGYGIKFLGLLALGGLQGVIGWWMVKSGLVDNPSVSHYRLAAHLGLATFIYALLIWMALTLLRRDGTLVMRPVRSTPALRTHGKLALVFVALAMLWGAFVAGLDAGLIYNEWPLMGGRFIPSEMAAITPFWHNLFENHAAVQFTHRWVAFAAFALTLAFAWRMRAPVLATCIVLQLCLGILTLLSSVSLPLATLHQAGALITLAALIYELHRVVHGAASSA